VNSNIARTDLAPGYSISRVIKGGWQLAGGHGTIDETQAVEDMRSFVQKLSVRRLRQPREILTLRSGRRVCGILELEIYLPVCYTAEG
jgi:hypothetical protein